VISTSSQPSCIVSCPKNALGEKLIILATLVTLENKLNTLVTWIQDDSVSPADRFQLLQEIAEEAARYKLGGDDKIRVSAGACDGVSLRVSSFLQLC
jgi:hypothetical protein